MKDQIRVLGVDDGPFKFGQKSVIVVGVVMRPTQYIEGICRTRVKVDGRDANTMLEKMISRYREVTSVHRYSRGNHYSNKAGL
jgi:endonuclease V-like protein UPF0215 family